MSVNVLESPWSLIVMDEVVSWGQWFLKEIQLSEIHGSYVEHDFCNLLLFI